MAYFGAPAERSHAAVSTTDDPGRVARDAYTYVHLVIIGGIIATAAGSELLIAEPTDALHGMGLAIVLGGPALFLLGESLFQWMTTGRANTMAWRLRADHRTRTACAPCAGSGAGRGRHWLVEHPRALGTTSLGAARPGVQTAGGRCLTCGFRATSRPSRGRRTLSRRPRGHGPSRRRRNDRAAGDDEIRHRGA